MKYLKKTLLAVFALCATACAAGAMGASCNPDSEGAHFHTWNDGEITTAAACETAGVKTFTCTDCGETKTEPVAAIGHEWGEWSVSKNPKSDEKGEVTANCTRTGCTGTHTADLPITAAITYTRTADNATCTQEGSQHYIATVEGKLVEFDLPTPVKGHNWNSWDVQMPTESGEGSATRTCAVPGCDGEQTCVLPALNDAQYELSTYPATCELDGQEVYTITVDGEEIVFTNTLEATGHSYGSVIDTSDKQAGDTVGKVCGNCGAFEKEYTYFDDTVLGTTTINEITTGGYYVNLNNSTTSYLCLRLDLTSAAVYNLSFTHFNNDKVATVQQVLLDGSDKVAFASRGSAPILSAYTGVASIEHNGNQIESFSFNAEDYVGHYLDIKMPVQKTDNVFILDISTDKSVKYGSNKVVITDEGSFVDTYAFVSDTDGTYSLTVPEGFVVLMNDEDFIVNGTWANFEAKAGETISFTFSYGAKGNYTVLVGDEISIPTLTVGGDQITAMMVSGEVYGIAVGDEVEEGTYTIEISGGFLIGRGVGYANLYFMAGGDGTYETVTTDGIYMNVTMASGSKDGCEYSAETGKILVTLTLKAGDMVYFAPAASFIPAGNSIAPILLDFKAA